MTTGTDRIREMLIARNKKLNLARFTTEVGITSTQFDGFIAGKTIPSATILKAMTKWLWGNATFDAERNVLVAGNDDKPKTLPSFPARAAINEEWQSPVYTVGPQPAEKPKARPTPKPLTRPGWVSNAIGVWQT